MRLWTAVLQVGLVLGWAAQAQAAAGLIESEVLSGRELPLTSPARLKFPPPAKTPA